MCQIIALQSKKSNIIKYLIENQNKIKLSLDRKGGEGYSISAFIDKAEKYKRKKIPKFIITKSKDFNEIFDEILTELIKIKENNFTEIIFFSRQRPEMEKEDVDLPPYTDKELYKYPEESISFVWMHGTIQNIPELEKKYNVKVEVDSEILTYGFIPREEIKGNYSAYLMHLNVDSNTMISQAIDNGLGMYNFWDTDVLVHTTDLYYFNNQNYTNTYNKRNLVVSYSGGMDITMSLIKALKTENYKNIYLIYFDYGARARDEEINALFKMEKYLNENYHVKAKAHVMEVEGLIHDISMIYNKKIKLIDKEAQGNENEAENTEAYVPFRNTIFVELLASFIEGNLDPNETDILLGLNLSEGMIYLDNSEIWLHNINELIKRAGKSYYPNLNVIAPYYNKTKINMLKNILDIINEKEFQKLLDISFSCYYPENGQPCGKCGSCLLRQKAIEVAKNYKGGKLW